MDVYYTDIKLDYEPDLYYMVIEKESIGDNYHEEDASNVRFMSRITSKELREIKQFADMSWRIDSIVRTFGYVSTYEESSLFKGASWGNRQLSHVVLDANNIGHGGWVPGKNGLESLFLKKRRCWMIENIMD